MYKAQRNYENAQRMLMEQVNMTCLEKTRG